MWTPAARAQLADEVLEEQVRRLAQADGKVLLHLPPLAPAEGRVGQDHVMPVALLDVLDVLVEQNASMSREEGEAYLDTMEKAGRYKQETW